MKKNYLFFILLLLTGMSASFTCYGQNPIADYDNAVVCPTGGLFLNLLVNDYDSDGGTIDPATIDLDPSTPAIDSSIVVNSVTFSVDSLGSISCVPSIALGPFSFEYTVKDNDGLLSNQAPVYIYFAPMVLTANDDFTATVIDATLGGFTPSVLDNDFVAGGFSTSGLIAQFAFGSGASFTMAFNGIITIPPGTIPGTYTFFYEAKSVPDCPGNFGSVTFTVDYLLFYADVDGDGYGDPTGATVTSPTPGYVPNNTDCDDANAAVHAGADFYVDADNDGFGAGSLVHVCTADASIVPPGYSTDNSDCDDTNATIHIATNYYVDADHDGFGIGSLVSVCSGSTIPSGYAANNSDCDDSDVSKYRNGNLFVDNDADGFDAGTIAICYGAILNVPTGYSAATSGSDCNDADSVVTNGCFTIAGNCGNTFVRTIDGAASGFIKPNIFKHPSGDFYTTNTFVNTVILSRYNTNGILIWSKTLDFGSADTVLQDLTIDATDNTVAGVVFSNYINPDFNSSSLSRNGFVFKFNETTQSFDWVKNFSGLIAFNIHQTDASHYAMTSQDANYAINMMTIDKATGNSIISTSSITGEFFSTYYSGSLYGACRYYANSDSKFFPSLYQWDVATSTSLWTKTYIKNTAVARIYPVAPIVDAGSLVQFSAGNDNNFDVYVNGNNKLFLVKTDLSGNLNWTKEITVAGYNRFDIKKIINTATGYYLILDHYNGVDRDFFFIIKTDKNGDVVWANRYGSSGKNSVTGVIENNGYLLVTGTTESLTGTNKMFLLKLDTLGQTDVSCSFVQAVSATASLYANLETNWPTSRTTLTSTLTSATATQNTTLVNETTYCNTSCTLEVNNPKNNSNNILVWPNPAEDVVNISTFENLKHIALFDINGRTLQSIDPSNSKTYAMDLGTLTAGIYLLEITTENGVSIQKIIKK